MSQSNAADESFSRLATCSVTPTKACNSLIERAHVTDLDGKTGLSAGLLTGNRVGNALYLCHRPVLGPNHSKLV